LDYEGYRFFQSSFDPDEGTVLSVSHDFGEQLLLMLDFMLFLLCQLCLQNTLALLTYKKIKLFKRKKSSFLLFCFSNEYNSFAQTHNHDHDEDGGRDHVENGTHVRTANRKAVGFVNKFKVSEEHAEKFGRLVIKMREANETD
jgi:hypothetical protein